MAVSPDDRAGIEAILRAWADEGLALIVTTGGTGLAPRDVTPDATLAVLDYAVPGIAEAMRAASLAATPLAMLSRAVAGVRGPTLIINLPGIPKAVR
jgi:molybdenum cofactor synthesis domain-containing protein